MYQRPRNRRNETDRGNSHGPLLSIPRRFYQLNLSSSKKGGDQRPIINMKGLNNFLEYQHFKVEGIHMLRNLLKKNDYQVKIDLEDAYITIPIWKGHQKYLRFLWRDTLWEFAYLPFGLASAPLVFTSILKPVVGLLRKQGIRLITYLDDLLIMSESKELARTHASLAANLLTSLGFIINHKKSVLIPCQQMEFLGFTVNSVAMTVNPCWAATRSQ